MPDLTYRIEHVWDFLNVPEERLDECLQEFGLALRMGRAGIHLLDALGETVPGGKDVTWKLGPAFVWIDDDKRTATLHVRSAASASER